MKSLNQIISSLGEANTPEGSAKLWAMLAEQSILGLTSDIEIVSQILSEIERPGSEMQPGIWNLLREVDATYWDMLTHDQRSSYVKYMKEKWGHFSEWMSSFVCCEVLGTRFPDLVTLRFFESAAESALPPQEELSAYGVQMVAQTSRSEQVVSAALEILERLERHSSEGLRHEALQAIQRIRRSSSIAGDNE